MFGDTKHSVVGALVISIQEVYFEEEYVAPVTCIVSFKKNPDVSEASACLLRLCSE